MKNHESQPLVGKKTLFEIFLVLSTFAMIFAEASVQTRFQELYELGELSKSYAWLANHFFNHIGNATDGFGLYTAFATIPELYRIFSKYKDKKSLIILSRIWAIFLPILVGAIIIDAESTQEIVSKFSFLGNPGIPESSDILVGLYGILGAVAGYDLLFGIIPDLSESETEN